MWRRLLAFLAPSRSKIVLRVTVLVITVGFAIWGMKSCSDDSPSTGNSKGKSASVAVDSSLSNALIDKTLTKHVDSSFVPRVSAVPIDRTSTFWKMFIFFGTAVLIYLFVRWMWVARLPAIPSGIFVALFGVTILHWLVWSLAPIWWESFYQSRAFWPVNLGIGVGAWLATIATSAGGKHINKVVWSVLGLASLVFITAAWPSRKKVAPVEPVVASNTTAIDPALRIPSETAELIDSVFQNVPSDSIDLMKRIACVESDCGIQFEPGDTTEVRRGRANSHAVGIFQIMETLHDSNCEKFGYDIMTARGNVGCAYLLFKENGVRDWEDSRRLWGNWESSTSPAPRTPSSSSRTPSVTATPSAVASQCLPNMGRGDQTLIVTAPAASDTTWSEKVLLCGRRLHWGEAQGTVEVVMRDDRGRVETLRVGPETDWPWAPRWVQVKSTADTAVTYKFIRSVR